MKKLLSLSAIVLIAALSAIFWLPAQAELTSPELRAMWHLDDGVGNKVSDASGNGNTGLGEKIKWDRGVKNCGVMFKNQGWINCGNDDSLSPSSELTVQAWFRPWNPNGSDFPTIVRKDGSYALTFAPNKKFAFTLWLDDKEIQLTSEKTDWKNGQWTHVAATYDGRKMVLYVDGKKDSEMLASGNITKSDASCFLASVEGKHAFKGPIDEVSIAGNAFTPEEVTASYEVGNYELVREATQFSPYFKKKQKRTPTAVVPGFLWVDAEDFFDYGGWWMDTQFVPQMGSPYLMAAGMGQPVKDALGLVSIPEAGTYRLWVRTKNWLKTASPGTFNIRVGGKTSPTVFGTADSKDWIWQDGGTFELAQKDATLILHDLSGFYGRCDALLLTTDLGYTPPAELQAYKNERNRLTGTRSEATMVGDYDVIVVGAGVAGCNAAIASARTGAKTALIQDRPMIGGSNSLELGVVVSGSSFHGHRNGRESGLNEEIGRLRSFNFHGKWSQGAEIVAANEPNLTIFLNTHVNEVEKDGSTITAVKAFNMIDGTRTRYTAKQFIDCTGDGWLGYYAGAEYMFGREAKETFGESNAPDQADNITMSGCLMTGHTLSYNTDKMKTPQPYTGPEWLWDLRPNTEFLEARNDYDGSHTYGRWWHENVGETDDLWDPENARDELIVLNLSYWNWIKNYSSLKEKATNYKLRIIPIGNAKRETRRLVGDHVLSQNEVLSAKPFADRVAMSGWSLDIHNPKGIWSKEGPFDFNTHAPFNHIPFRSLYSKNISNLLFAGRQVSVTHVALGTVRVQGTTGVMGQAVGTAAAMCVDKKVNPRGLYQSHITELQQKLLKDDQYILNLKNEDPADLARRAKVNASSFESDAFSPDQILSGVTRIVDETKSMNMWKSDPEQTMPQWVELDLDQAETFNTVYLTFDTNMDTQRHCSWEHTDAERMPPESARNYRVDAFDGSKWITVADVENNYQRRRIHRFPAIRGSKLKVTVTQTNGDASARLFEVRIYNEK